MNMKSFAPGFQKLAGSMANKKGAGNSGNSGEGMGGNPFPNKKKTNPMMMGKGKKVGLKMKAGM